MSNRESRTKLLTYNFFVFGMATIISKLITFILTPIYSRYFTPDQYGIFDLTNMLIQVLEKVSILGVTDAIFRLYFDKDDLDYRTELISTGLKIVMYSSLALSGITFVLNQFLARTLLGGVQYTAYINVGILVVFTTNITVITKSILRMENNRKKIIQVTFVQAILTLLLNIFFVVILKKGILYVLVTNFIYQIVVFAITFSYGKKYIDFSRLSLNRPLAKEILQYGLPLMPVFLGYWVLSAADRLSLKIFYDTAAVGLYGIGTKFASIMNLFQTVFGTAWQHFSFSIMGDHDASKVYGKLFDLIVFVAGMMSTILIFSSDFIFKFLFAPNYYEAWVISPLLCLGPFIMILRWISGVGTSIKKKTYLSTFSVLLAVILNIVGNLILVPRYYLMGAATATLISYLGMLVFTFAVSNRLVKIEFSKVKAFIVAIVLGSGFYLKYSFFEGQLMPSIGFTVLFWLVFVGVYMSLVKELFGKFASVVKRR